MEKNKEMEYNIKKMGVGMKVVGKIINQMELGFLFMLTKNLI